MNRPAVIGVDPSSRKLAAVYGIAGREHAVRFTTMKLPQDKPVACLMAYEWMRDLVASQKRYGKVYAAIELPVLGRGGPGSTIPQAQINGALLAGAHVAEGEAILVNNSHAKKQIIGKGNASKDEISGWVAEYWPDLYESIEGDQDLCDSAMIYRWGVKVADQRDRMARRRNDGKPIVASRTLE